MKKSFYEMRNNLRALAIADIRAYVEKNGVTRIKNLDHYSIIELAILDDILYIKNERVTRCPTEYLRLIVDMLNQMP